MSCRTLLLITISLLLSFNLALARNQQSAQISHHEISVTIDPENHTIKGSDKITAVFPGNTRGNTVAFYLNKSIEKISLIDSPGFSLETRSFHDASKKSDQKSDVADKNRFQHYIVKSKQTKSELTFTLAFDGIIYDPLKTVGQDYARGFATTSGLIDTQGVYLAGSSGWIPMQKSNLFTFKLKTNLPLGWQSVSQGRETFRGAVENSQVNEWTCDKPMEEIYLIAGKYVITEEDHHGIKVMTYTYAEEPELSKKYRQATKRYLDMYSEQIGPYPYEKFALVENFWQTGYGMPSFTLLGSQVIRLPFIIGTSYGHEILHNWWGNGVFVDYESGNWCEGLTNYMADHYYKKLTGEDAAYRRTMLQNYLNYVQEGKDFPLTQFTERHDPATQTIGYGKSAMLFHMLYKMLGEEKFFAAIRTFYQNNLFKTASWEDLEREFSRQHGSQLSWFFDQWLNREGAPALKLIDSQLKKSGEKFIVSITLNQGTPYYRLNVPVLISGKSDTTVILPMNSQEDTFKIELPEPPDQICIDPEFDLFRKLDYDEIPPALSQTYGAQQSIVILPAAAEKAVLTAYQKISEQWKTSDNVIIKLDKDTDETELHGKAVWIWGRENKFLSRVKTGLAGQSELNDTMWRLDNEEFPLNDFSVILTMRHPGNPELSWTFVHLSGIENFPGIARKLPHYGKYGYLVFKGSDNVLRGEWQINASSMCWTSTAR